MANGNDPTFVKHDGGKLMWSLFPWRAGREVVKVLMWGAGRPPYDKGPKAKEKPYPTHNWRRGTDWNRYFDAATRHLNSWWEDGEDNDPESGLHHLAHATCDVLFLIHFVVTSTGTDNRPCKEFTSNEGVSDAPAHQQS